MNRWNEYLFRNHSADELSDWARKLHYFRFCRAFGGHANDGDRLLLALQYSNPQDLAKLSAELGVNELVPGIQKIAGIDALVSLYASRVFISLAGAAGDPYEVTDADVCNAASLETKLGTALNRHVDPPIEDRHCVSPNFYPEFWSTS